MSTLQRASSEVSAPTVVSLFAGCGGSSLGYKMSGYDCRLAVEWDAHACVCYRLNFPSTPLYEGDIGKLSGSDALARARLQPRELDVLDGSPPCQGFSTAGRRVMGDARNHLFLEYVRLLRVFQPRALIMENVTGLVKGKMRLVFGEILSALKGSGYRVAARVLDASYFGVPQMRQRLFFVGVREDLNIEPSHPKAQTRPTALQDVMPWLSASNTNHKSKSPLWEIPDFVSAQKPARTIQKTANYEVTGRAPTPPDLDDAYGRLWSRVPVGGNAGTLLKGKGFGSTKKIDPRRPSFTLPKLQTGRGYATLVAAHEPRALTIEEAKIIGSFPADFQLTGSYQQQWARIGNSVPPLLARAVAAHVRSILEAT